jgi:hypothetical protein
MIIVEGAHSVHIAGPAHLVEEGRELAWAETHVVKNPLYAWVLGKYVETGRPNDNGHIFDLEELRTAKSSVLYAPMNMLHVPHQIMGTFVANEIVYPTGEGAAAGGGDPPYLEALAAFWKYYFPEAFEMVRMAHNEGSLAWSMECIPQSVTCANGCDQTFAYAGRQDSSYCDHLNMPAAKKKLNKPQYSAGALVVPPALPAWKNAKVTELSTLLTTELETMAAVEEQVATEFPHLSGEQWEQMMSVLMKAAMKKNSKPHMFKVSPKDGKTCAMCGQPQDGAIHVANDPSSVPGAPTTAELDEARNLGRLYAADPKGPHAYVSPAPGKDFLPCKVCGKAKAAHKGKMPEKGKPGDKKD